MGVDVTGHVVLHPGGQPHVTRRLEGDDRMLGVGF